MIIEYINDKGKRDSEYFMIPPEVRIQNWGYLYGPGVNEFVLVYARDNYTPLLPNKTFKYLKNALKFVKKQGFILKSGD